MSVRLVSKSALARLARSSGVGLVVRRRLRKYLTVLCYHGVVASRYGNPYLYRNTVTTEEFECHLQLLARHYHPVSVQEIVRWTEGAADLPERAVLVTFDDGYRNNLTNAAPLLSRYGVPALVNICTSYIGEERMLWTQEIDARLLSWVDAKVPMPAGRPTEVMPQKRPERVALAARVRKLCKNLPDEERRAYMDRLRGDGTGLSTEPERELFSFLNWDEVRQLGRYGVDIGSHTVNHPILTRLPAVELKAELAESKTIIEKQLQHPCAAAAYPNGGRSDISAAVFAAAKAVGFKLGFTLVEGFNSRDTNPYGLLRIAVAADMSSSTMFFDRIAGLSALVRSAGWKGGDVSSQAEG